MTVAQRSRTSGARRQVGRAAFVALAALAMGACAKSGSRVDASLNGPTTGSTSATTAQKADAAAPSGASELQKATAYWGQQYVKNPSDLKNALSYAKNLKAMGQKQEAFAVLQQAASVHDNDRELASEYGRLALELGQVAIARTMLEIADDPVKPDWRVLSARGAVLAKSGKAGEAITFLERARTLAPEQTSVLNNLAMAYIMSGEPQKAEPLLRQASTAAATQPRIRQNLALALGLQGKYDESTRTAAQDVASDKAAANTALLRKMVALEPKAAPVAIPAQQQVAGGQGSGDADSPKDNTNGPAPAVAGWSARVKADPAPAAAQQAGLPALRPSEH
jgi:Flp pilus assembly protein TadD